MKLAGKLRSLIHLAENQSRRDEARKHARLSADEAPEVRAADTQAEGAEASGADVQALIQEVVSAVNREMELRRERRQEDNHEPWW
jgi:type II secretory pathway component PulM